MIDSDSTLDESLDVTVENSLLHTKCIQSQKELTDAIKRREKQNPECFR